MSAVTGGNDAQAEKASGLIWPSSLLVQLVRDLTDSDDCHFDHHGYCQAHGWLTDERPCPHGRAKNFLSAIDGDDDPGRVTT